MDEVVQRNGLHTKLRLTGKYKSENTCWAYLVAPTELDGALCSFATNSTFLRNFICCNCFSRQMYHFEYLLVERLPAPWA